MCAAHLPNGVRPVVAADPASRVLIIGQAPGRRVHESGVVVNFMMVVLDVGAGGWWRRGFELTSAVCLKGRGLGMGRPVIGRSTNTVD